MKLHELSPAPGSKKDAFRKGRGHGSGNGKTAGKGAVVDTKAIVEAGLVKKVLDGVKVLGNGELSKKLTIQVAAFSESAKKKIEEAGGKAEVM